jgi:hypothetical protein
MDHFPLDAAKVPSASIGVHRPSTKRFVLDADGDLAASAGDTNAGPFGATTDIALTGDWNGDGRDEIGFYRPGTRRFYLDFDGDGLWNATADRLSLAFGTAGDLPVIGDWDGDGIDDIGTYSQTSRVFTLDSDGSLSPTAGDLTTAAFQTFSGLPLAGDWNGDGKDEIGVWRPTIWRFYLDYNGSHTWNSGDRSPIYGQAGDNPMVGDWNGDAKDEIGVYRPSTRRFYLDADRSFTPTAGDETSGVFGLSTDKPLLGRW